MKRLAAILIASTFIIAPAYAGNNGNGVGNTGPGNQGQGPNDDAGNAGGNGGEEGNDGEEGEDTPSPEAAAPGNPRNGGGCHISGCSMQKSDDFISRMF